MQLFDVLSRNTPIYRSALLEASAGTGKTFAIEHLVVRLLIESEPGRQQPCGLTEIVAVTFTRAATREMKARIHHNIAKAIYFLRHPSVAEAAPDYLQPHLNASSEHQAIVRMRLEDALDCFDEAQIFTLHGLCAQALRDRPESLSVSLSEDPLNEVVLRVIDDFLRTNLQSEVCHPIQLKRVLGHFRGDDSALKKSLFNQITKGLKIDQEPDFSTRFGAFHTAMLRLTQTYGWQAEKLIQDYNRQASLFKNLDGKPAPAYRPAVERMAKLFDQDSWSISNFEQILRDDLVLAKFERKAQKKKGSDTPELWYPDASAILRNDLLPIIEATLNPKRIFAWMAHHCQNSLQRYLHEEETGGPDQILQRMLAAVEDPEFVAKIQRRYRIAIVDECQDTDPMQWTILNRLFIQAKPPAPFLVLVGDPKQSIYAFRQADIYSYLSVANQFAPQERLALRTNYRSQPDLVHAINTLFAHTHSPGLIALPRLKTALPFPEAYWTNHHSPYAFTDNRKAIHFLLLKGKRGRLRTWPGEELERNAILPAIAQEIRHLRQQQISLKQIAILVRDRHQAEIAQQVFDEWGIPALSQRQGSLDQSPAYAVMVEWLEAMASSQDSSAVHKALMGRLIRISPEQLVTDCATSDLAWQLIHQMRTTLIERGFAAHFEQLLHTCWPPMNSSLLEQLMGTKEGGDLYRDFAQIASLLMDHQYRTHCQIEGLLTFLDSFPLLAQHEDERLRIQPDLTQDAVRILTIHTSKGLEYDIVFAPGLMKRTKADEMLIPNFSMTPPCLQVSEEGSDTHLAFCRELDAEKARQAYVAMTRAKYRLYLPVAIAEEGWEISIGEAAPLELLLARLGRPLADDAELYKRINSADGQQLCEFIEKNSSSVSLSYHWLNQHDLEKAPIRVNDSPPTLYAPKNPHVPRRPQRLYSFTSLQEEQQQVDECLAGAPHNLLAVDLTPHTLPAGRDTGILIHHLLEAVPFTTLAGALTEESMQALIAPLITHSVLSPWAKTVAELLFHAMHAPMPFQGFDLPQSLSNVNPQCVSRETSFLYGTQGPQNGFLRGSIDLLLSHGERYYLIDWKSNWLGPTHAHYNHAAMERAVKHHGYDLQAKIYTEALKRYLRLVDPRPFDECFGGVFYLFVRGIDSRGNSDHGIYRMI